MRCSRCNFENIPGEGRCVKCGSILILEGEVDVHPPRMSPWKKPLRTAARWFRIQRKVPEQKQPSRISAFVDMVTSDSVIGLLLSLIPGLAHLIKGRFGEIRFHFLMWLISILGGLFFYGSAPGFILIGLALGIHVWIALQYGLINELSQFGEKITAGILTALLIFLCYRGVFILTSAAFGLSGGFCSLNVPAQRVETGDYLLTRNIRDKNEITRGCLVLFVPVTVHGTSSRRSSGLMVGQVVALPGETVEMKNDSFVINNKPLDPNVIAVPLWLPRRGTKLYVYPASYFISSEYNITMHGNINITDDNIRDVCIINTRDIRAKAFMRWWPLGRRGFLRQE